MKVKRGTGSKGKAEVQEIGYTTREVLKKFPKASDLSLARKLFKENPLFFSSLQHARNLVMYHRGKIKGRGLCDPVPHQSLHTKTNPYGLPDSDYEETPPLILSSSINRVLLGSDFHIPYQDNKAISKWLDYGKAEKPDAIYLNGDVIDCYQVSKYEHDPTKRRFKEEVKLTIDFLKTVRKTFKNIPIFYKQGNHDSRWSRFLRAKAPEIFDMDEFQLEIVLRLGEMGIIWSPEQQLVKFGNLNIVHGHEVKFSSSANGARALWLKVFESTIASHAHRFSEHSEKDLSGKIQGCWVTGCLAGLNQDYNILGNKCTHGFADIIRYDDGSFSVLNKKIINNRIV